MKEDNSFGNSDVVSFAKLKWIHTQTTPQIDVINDNMNPVVETIIDKGMVMQGTYEKCGIPMQWTLL